VTVSRSTRGTLVIDEQRCKGCELCVAACPPRVLVMSHKVNEMGYRYPVLNDGCTGCTACQLVCPDFVFSVYRFADGPRAAPTNATDHPGEEGASPSAAP
jgi:2-oxoglutarate ferredoxin oxidoreductase subunit delta